MTEEKRKEEIIVAAVGCDYTAFDDQDPETILIAREEEDLEDIPPELTDEILEALADLAPGERVALWCHCAGMSFLQMQREMGIDRKNAHRAKKKAVSKLRKKILSDPRY